MLIDMPEAFLIATCDKCGEDHAPIYECVTKYRKPDNYEKHQTFIFGLLGMKTANSTACIGCNWESFELLEPAEAVIAHDKRANRLHDCAIWVHENGICPCGNKGVKE